MANHELTIPPVFNENLRKYETEDEVHADVFNAVENQLINNDSYLKSHIDTAEQNIKEHKETTDIHVTKAQKDSWTAKATTTEATTTTKGLMSSADKTKLNGITTGAEVNQNAFSNVKVGSNVVSANGKTATIEFTNGTNITIAADNATKKVTINGPSNVTTSTNGLMTKEDKIKLNNIATNANNYVHPTHPSKTSGLYKVTIDGTGHVSATSAVTKADITNLGIPAQDTNTTYGVATASTLGLVKSGTDITVDSSGNVSVVDDSHNHIISNVDGLQSALDAKAASSHTHSNYVNQNAFSNVTVGSTTIAADSATDTLTLTAGSNITLTPDATNDKITISATDTKFIHPTYPSKSNGLYKVTVDATGHISATSAVTKADITNLGIPAQDTNTTYGVATASTLGLIKSGTDITVDSSGNVSVVDDSHNHIISNVDGLQTALNGKAPNDSPVFLNSISMGREKGTTVGYNSIAIGYQVEAIGNYSYAGGEGTVAPAASSHAEGKNTTASGEASHTEGINSTASGQAAHAEGYTNTALKKGAHAEGSSTEADGEGAHAEGVYTKALGEGAHVEGCMSGLEHFNLAHGEGAHAEGCDARAGTEEAPARAAHAEGSYTEATGDASHAEGDYTKALGNASHAEGKYTKATGEGAHAEGIGDNLQQIVASGTASHAEGYYTQATGDYSHAEGYSTTASGEASHAEGLHSKAIGNYTHAEGNTVNAIGDYSHAEGRETIASGAYSHAEGSGTTSSGTYSHAEGSGTTSSGLYSHAEGKETIASKAYSHTEGYITTASGDASHAEGYITKASGNYSHAEGYYTTASGIGSHAEGTGDSNKQTIAYGEASHAEGYKTTAGTSGNSDVTGAHAEGRFTTASGLYSHAEGNYTKATGQGSHAEGDDTHADGLASHAEGYYTTASQIASHAEGFKSIASEEYSHAEGYITTASGLYSHAEGANTQSNGLASHAEGLDTIASSSGSHAEGYRTSATGNSSHAEGRYSEAHGEGSHAEGYGTSSNERTVAYGIGSHAEGNRTIAGTEANNTSLVAAHAEGSITIASGISSHAEGGNTKASGVSSHAEGSNTTASGSYSHAEGFESYATGNSSHAEANRGYATGDSSHAEGFMSRAEARASHAEGSNTKATGDSSHAEGYWTKASNHASHACGKYNKEMVSGGEKDNKVGDAFVIGNGTGTYTSLLSNAFRVTYAGDVYGLSAFKSSGADYAEYFEWIDGNTENEDRVGYFVTMKGNKIKKATSSEDYILGIVSAQPCIIGNSDEDWLGRWQHDEFGRFLKREVKTPVTKWKEVQENSDKEDEEPFFKLIEVETGEYVTGWDYVPNPDYDSNQAYVERKDRKEWSAIGMMGVLAVRDDGTCKVNGFCTVKEGGIATTTNDRNGYRVIERVTENIVKVVFR